MTAHPRNSERKNPLKAQLRTARGNAKKGGLEFSISLTDFPEIPNSLAEHPQIPKECPVFGTPLYLNGEIDDLPSLDRIDNTRRYVSGNVILVSRRANRLKGDATPEELRKVADFYGSLSKKSK